MQAVSAGRVHHNLDAFRRRMAHRIREALRHDVDHATGECGVTGQTGLSTVIDSNIDVESERPGREDIIQAFRIIPMIQGLLLFLQQRDEAVGSHTNDVTRLTCLRRPLDFEGSSRHLGLHSTMHEMRQMASLLSS